MLADSEARLAGVAAPRRRGRQRRRAARGRSPAASFRRTSCSSTSGASGSAGSRRCPTTDGAVVAVVSADIPATEGDHRGGGTAQQRRPDLRLDAPQRRGAVGALGARGDHRRPHRAVQPPVLPRAPQLRDRALPGRGDEHRAPVLRPGQLPRLQRAPRARLRRQGAARGRPGARELRPSRRPRGALRRRGVRRHPHRHGRGRRARGRGAHARRHHLARPSSPAPTPCP